MLDTSSFVFQSSSLCYDVYELCLIVDDDDGGFGF